MDVNLRRLSPGYGENRRRLYREKRCDLNYEKYPTDQREKRIRFVARFRGINFSRNSFDGFCEDDLQQATMPINTSTNQQEMDMDDNGKNSIYSPSSSLSTSNMSSFSPSSGTTSFGDSSFSDSVSSQSDLWSISPSIHNLRLDYNDHTMMTCPYCHEYTMAVKDDLLKCAKCTVSIPLKKNCSIRLIKDRIVKCVEKHRQTCPHDYNSYALCKSDIVLSCDHCSRSDSLLVE